MRASLQQCKNRTRHSLQLFDPKINFPESVYVNLLKDTNGLNPRLGIYTAPAIIWLFCKRVCSVYGYLVAALHTKNRKYYLFLTSGISGFPRIYVEQWNIIARNVEYSQDMTKTSLFVHLVVILAKNELFSLKYIFVLSFELFIPSFYL